VVVVDLMVAGGDEVEAVTEGLRTIHADVIIHALPHKTVVKAAFKARIPMRIGTGKRWHTWGRLTHPHWFSRKNSDLHEAQLNLKLLSSLKLSSTATLEQLTEWAAFGNIPPCPTWAQEKLAEGKRHLICHPKSRGSALDYDLDDWKSLIEQLDPDQWQVFITGTPEEGKLIHDFYGSDWPAGAEDLTGKFSLNEYIGFIGACDALVACSTGPLHLAAALGIHAVGLYPSERPMHPGRWAPLGKHAQVLEAESTSRYLEIPVQSVALALTTVEG
jgi:ADP-heptose:LPS heptosyltransferase